MAVTGFTALILIFACTASNLIFSGGLVLFAAGAVSAAVLLISKEFKNHPVPAYIFAAMIFSGILLMTCSVFDIDTAEKYYDTDCDVTAVVTDDLTVYNNSNACVLKTKTVNGENLRTKILVYSKTSFDYEAGDVIRFKAKLTDNLSKRDFVERLSYVSDGEYLYAFLTSEAKTTLVSGGDGTLQHGLYHIRATLKARIHSLLQGKEGAVTTAMLIGDKSGVSSAVKRDFSLSGISHLFAVSGLHLSVWVMSLYTFLKKTVRKRRIPEIICIIFTLFFMALTGFTASVCRAGIMLGVVLLSRVFGEENDSLNSLGIAVFLILLVNPMAAVSVSLLLSFSATLGILTAFPPIENKIDELIFTVKNRRVKNALKYILSLVAISVCASVFTLPVTSFFIGSVSLVAPVTNAFVSLAATAQMIFGGLSAIAYPLKFIANPLAFICGLLAKYVLFVSSFLADIPFCSVETSSVIFRVVLLLGTAGLICAAILIQSDKRRVKCFICIVLSLCVVGTCAYFLTGSHNTKVRAFNTDGGVCVEVSHGGFNMFLGCGGNSNYPENETFLAVEDDADFLLVPDRNPDNSSMLMYFTENFEPQTVISGERNQTLGLLKNDYKISNHFKTEPWSGASLEFVKNGGSTFACLDDGAMKILIIFSCADINNIPADFLCADVLITCAEIPEDFDFGSFSAVIFSAEDDNTYEKIEGAEFVRLCDYSDAEISTDRNGKISINCNKR